MKTKIKKWYSMGLWSEDMVRNAVDKGVISADDYKEITGRDYE